MCSFYLSDLTFSTILEQNIAHVQGTGLLVIVTNDQGYIPFVVVTNLSLFMTYHRNCNKSNTIGATFEVGTDYPPGTPQFIPPLPSLSGVRVLR